MSERDLVWEDDKLYWGYDKVGEIVPDKTYPGMWRVVLSDGSLSDMVNRTRAKDACEALYATGNRQRRRRQSYLAYRAALDPEEVLAKPETPKIALTAPEEGVYSGSGSPSRYPAAKATKAHESPEWLSLRRECF